MDTAALTYDSVLEPPRRSGSIRLGNAQVDFQSGTAQNPSGHHRLRKKELELLIFLYQHTGTIISRDELLRSVWKYHGALLTRTVDQTVATLRRKLADSATEPKYLLTVYGIGYCLRTNLET